MKKIIVAGLVIVIGVVGFLLVNQKEETDKNTVGSSSALLETSETSVEENKEQLPSLAELKKRYGKQLVDLGECRIITAFYLEDPRVQLKNEQGDVLELTISSIQEEDETFTFSIDLLETVNERKLLGERMKLAQNENKYYEYQ